LQGTIVGIAYRYDDSLAGLPLGCGGVYDPDNPDIVAVGPARYDAWPCGTSLRICGPAGCITATRRDSCPGCGANVIDLSRAAFLRVCGWAASCSVFIRAR